MRIDPALAPLIERAMPLTWYAWEFRYPGTPEEPTSQEAREALALAREVVESFLGRLPA